MIKYICYLLVISALAYSDEIPKKILYPTDSDSVNYQDVLCLKNGLSALEISDSMLKALASVALTRTQFDCNKELIKVENQFNEGLTISVMNAPKTIKGTLLAQDFQITKLEYEMAKMKKETADEINKKKKKYEIAKALFGEYWKNLGYAD